MVNRHADPHLFVAPTDSVRAENRYLHFFVRLSVTPMPPRPVSSIHATAFIHPHAHVLGDVRLAARVSVWPTAVIRGDTDTITIGDDSNVTGRDGHPRRSRRADDDRQARRASDIARSCTARPLKMIV